MPLPKGFSGDLRIMTIADPFDEVVYRTIVGRIARRAGTARDTIQGTLGW
jgi:hypothetical protein